MAVQAHGTIAYNCNSTQKVWHVSPMKNDWDKPEQAPHWRSLVWWSVYDKITIKIGITTNHIKNNELMPLVRLVCSFKT